MKKWVPILIWKRFWPDFQRESPGFNPDPLEIEAIMRPAEQGGRGGRCSGGGLPPRLMVRICFSRLLRYVCL